MPMNNSLNVSELLKRLGVVGDSLGSAPILEELRLTINLADLSGLVPPLAAPVAGASDSSVSAAGTRNQFSLHCRSPGGLTMLGMSTNGGTQWRSWISDTDPFAAAVANDTTQLAFGQPAVSIFQTAPAAASVSPAGHFIWRGFLAAEMLPKGNWVGPGQFWNIEADTGNVSQLMSIVWREYPAALNP